jgi:hypothetical protein
MIASFRMLHLTHQLPEYHAQAKQQISADKVTTIRLIFTKTTEKTNHG